MSAPGGYYKMYRGWMDHPVFGREPFTRAQAWCWLIERAAWRDTIQSVGRHNVRVQRGQIAVAVRYLAEAWQWSKSSVDRFLTRLETGTMIGTQSGTQYSIISICNYEKYQADSDDGGTRVGTGSGTRAGHGRDKEEAIKHGRKDIGDRDLFGEEQAKPETNDGFERWWMLVPRKVGKGAARLAFRAALKKAGSIEVLSDGIRRYAASVQDKEARYIAHPNRWLRDERWLDEVTTDSSQAATDFDREWAAAQAAGPEAIDAFLTKYR